MRFSGGEIAFEKQQKRDEYIKNYCINNNINLMEISYKQNTKDKVFEYLNNYFKNAE